MRTCKHRPCCWRHNASVAKDINNRKAVLGQWVRERWRMYTKSSKKKQLIRKWVKQMRTNLKTKHNVLHVISKIVSREEKILVNMRINHRKAPTFAKYGKNICFLMAALARPLRSVMYQHQLIDGMMEKYAKRIIEFGDTSFAPEFLISCHWLQWGNGKDIANRAFKQFVKSDNYTPPGSYDYDDFNNMSYSDMLSTLANQYLIAMAVKTSESEMKYREPDFFVDQAVHIMKKQWNDIDTNLKISKTKKLVSFDDKNIHKAYFVTHVFFMANDYGNRGISDRVPLDMQLRTFKLLRRWFMDIHNKNAVFQNLEIFTEICYTLLYIKVSVQNVRLPAIFWSYFHEFLELGMKHDLASIPLRSTFKQGNVFFPRDDRVQTLFSDYHAHAVIAFFLTEGIRYILKQHPSNVYQLPNYNDADHVTYGQSDIDLVADTEPNESLKRLNEDGYIHVHDKHESLTFCKKELYTFSQRLLKYQTKFQISDLLQRNYPDDRTIVRPGNTPTKMSEALNSLHVPSSFWKYMGQRIATELGIPKSRVVMFKDQTFVRIKRGGGSTKAHSDFYHFIESTDLLARIHRVDGYNPSDGLCVVCLRNPGVVFDKVAVCKSCASGHIPLYTAWISLGTYNNREHSILQLIPRSHKLDYTHIDDSKVMKNELPKSYNKRAKWKFPNESGMNMCDMILFNCKTIHVARPSKQKHPRMSIDVRFAILPQL